MIPMHYGTIAELSDPEEPRIVLEELIREKPQYKDKVKILKIGEQIVIEWFYIRAAVDVPKSFDTNFLIFRLIH